MIKITLYDPYAQKYSVTEGDESQCLQRLKASHIDLAEYQNLRDALIFIARGQTPLLVGLEGFSLGDEPEPLDKSLAWKVVEDMVGRDMKFEKALSAACFLSHRPYPSVDILRQSRKLSSDEIGRALFCVQMADIPTNRQALQALVDLTEMEKSEGSPEPQAPRQASPVNVFARKAAMSIQNALDAGEWAPAHPSGKHSKGASVAFDLQDQKAWLLKPDPSAGPASGMTNDQATAPAREAAFWTVAWGWGLDDFVPETALVALDGQEVAAISLLSPDYKTMDTMLQNDQSKVFQAFEPYIHNGIIYRWAVLDWVLGNVDRHAGNIMVSKDGLVQLIDHGSTFAGQDFAPEKDPDSFIPFYLRYTVPTTVDFRTLNPQVLRRYMPTLQPFVDAQLESWVTGLDGNKLESICHIFGIDPEPAKARLAKLAAAPADKAMYVAIQDAWLQVGAI